jgi:hypothetical protein
VWDCGNVKWNGNCGFFKGFFTFSASQVGVFFRRWLLCLDTIIHRISKLF